MKMTFLQRKRSTIWYLVCSFCLAMTLHSLADFMVDLLHWFFVLSSTANELEGEQRRSRRRGQGMCSSSLSLNRTRDVSIWNYANVVSCQDGYATVTKFASSFFFSSSFPPLIRSTFVRGVKIEMWTEEKETLGGREEENEMYSLLRLNTCM